MGEASVSPPILVPDLIPGLRVDFFLDLGPGIFQCDGAIKDLCPGFESESTQKYPRRSN